MIPSSLFAGEALSRSARKSSGVLMAILVSGILAPGLGMAEVTASESAPTKNILASTKPQDPPATVGWKNDSVANQWTGVSFVVSKNVTLEGLTVAYSEAGRGIAGQEVSVTIIQLGPENLRFSERITQAATVHTETFSLPRTLPEQGYLAFAFTETVLLPASPVPYAYILSFGNAKSGQHFALARGMVEAGASAVKIDKESRVFRSDDGGGSYSNLTVANIPVLYLQGTAKNSASLTPPETAAALATAARGTTDLP